MDRERFLPNITEEDRKLIKLFQGEVDRINLLYLKAIHSNDITKANQLLKQIKKISNYLTTEYGKRADVRIPQEYVKGSSYMDDIVETDTAVLQLSQQAVETYLEELGPIHIEAVNALVDNSKNYVRSSLDGMERQALTMLNELQQSQVREELAKGVIGGEGRMNDRIIDYFTDNGISGFKDRGGKYRSMDRYVDMLVRTETNIANTQGTINRALEFGITKFGIVEHPDCCKECAEMNGDIVDIREGTVELPPFHPNCRGYIIAVIDNELEQPNEEKIIDNEQQEDIQITDEMRKDRDIQKAVEFIDKKYADNPPKIGYGNAVVVSSYTTGMYSDWNATLRHGAENVDVPFKYPEFTDSLTRTIANNSEVYSGKLYRGTKIPVETLEEMKSTGKYVDKAFMSFTNREDIAESYSRLGKHSLERVIFEIENEKVFDTEPYSIFSNEKEYLINREIEFKVTNIEQDGTAYKIKLSSI